MDMLTRITEFADSFSVHSLSKLPLLAPTDLRVMISVDTNRLYNKFFITCFFTWLLIIVMRVHLASV